MLLLVVVHSELILHMLCSSQEGGINLDNYCDSWKKNQNHHLHRIQVIFLSASLLLFIVLFLLIQFSLRPTYSGQYIKHKSETLTKIPLELSGSDDVLQS